MNMNNMLMYSAIMMIPEVVYTDMTSTKNKATYNIKCSHSKRDSVVKKVMKLMTEILDIDAEFVPNTTKSSIGLISSTDFDVLIKPVIKNTHKQNENRLIELYSEYTPGSIVFADGKTEYVVTDVVDVLNRNVLNVRDKITQVVNKEDVCIKTKTKSAPISIKMNGGNTFWESADGLLNSNAEETLAALIKRFKIKDFNSRNLTKDILLNTKDIDLYSCVYGSDILPNGCVAVTNFDDYKFINGTLYIYCDRVFTSREVMNDETFAPTAIIGKCKNRNTSNPILKDLSTKVCTRSRAKNAVNIDNVKHLKEIYDVNKDV